MIGSGIKGITGEKKEYQIVSNSVGSSDWLIVRFALGFNGILSISGGAHATIDISTSSVETIESGINIKSTEWPIGLVDTSCADMFDGAVSAVRIRQTQPGTAIFDMVGV